MSEIPWWLAAIVFFFVGMAVERFIIDRRFIRETREVMEDVIRRHGSPPADDHH